MNKLAYRVIFNKNRGMLMAVAESVSSQGKGRAAGGASGASSSVLMRLVHLGVAIAALFGGVAVVQAQMVAYKSGGPQPIPAINQTANGRPLVQIVTPNAAGVSHNRYDRYNVDSKGVILNNARTVTQTQLGGLVDGNPNLANGSARLILNEVMGSGRSQLNGYTEVAGQRAEVIIANPNGITCSGCGFINTSRGALTTGRPLFGGDGSLNAFRVTRGDIQINGLNGANTDQLDLIARSVQVNGQLWANQLNVFSGSNQVRYADLDVIVIQGEGAQPTVGIDVAQLGGMYANKIRLIGTEAGVGVASLGTISAQAGDLQLDSRGKITLAGKTNASGQVTIHSADSVINAGTLYGQQAVQLSSDGQIANSGTMAAQGDLTLSAGSINSSGVLGAGIDANSQATQAGSLHLAAAAGITATGQNIAGANVAIDGASLNLVNARTSAAGSITLTARAGDIDHSGGNLQAAGAAAISAAGAVINNHGLINVSQLTSNSASLSNSGGTLNQSGSGATGITTTGSLNNNGGAITTNAQNLNLQAGSLSNDAGAINHAGSGTLTINTGALSNIAGNAASNGQLALTAASINNQRGSLSAAGGSVLHSTGAIGNQQGVIQAGSGLTIAAGDIDNGAGRITSLNADGLVLSASGQLTNAAGGVIGGNGDVTVTAANANNAGSITASRNLTANIGNLLDNSRGRLAAGSALQANAAAFKNNGGVVDAATVALTMKQLDNAHGKINADQLTIRSNSLNNQAGQIAQFGTDANVIDVAEILDNSNGGVIQTNSADLTLTPRQLNNAGGTIALAGTGKLKVSVNNGQAALQNQGGSIGSNGQVSVIAGSIDNRSGTIFSQAQAEIVATQGDIDNSAGAYLGGSQLTVRAAGSINNSAGKIEGLKSGLAIRANSLNNAAGTVQSVAAAPLSIMLAQDINNGVANGVGGFIGSAGAFHLHAGTIDNSGGTLYAKDDLTLQSDGQLINADGVIQSAASLSAAAAGAVRNDHGRIEANGGNATLTVSGSSIDNSAGRIANSGSGLTRIDGGSRITNTNAANTAERGAIGGNGDVLLSSAYLDNSQYGQIIAAGNLTLNHGSALNNNAGKLYAGRHLQLDQAGARLSNIDGNIGAAGDIDISVASLDNLSGLIGSSAGTGAGGDITLASSGAVNNSAGTLGSNRNLRLTANTLLGNGKVIAAQDASISLQGDYANTAGNTLSANRDLTLSITGDLTNTGNLEAVRNVTLNAANVNNQASGLINAGEGATVIHAANSITNTGRIYGTEIAIGAQTLSNDVDAAGMQAGVIASRNTLQIGAQSITNREHALIQSLGDMTLGGALDADNNVGGNAVSILNASATIDAGGALTLHTAALTNRNDHFSTELQIDETKTKRVIEYSPVSAPGVWFAADQVTWGDSGDGGIVLILPGNWRNERFHKRDYTQIVQQSVVKTSDPGKITSGGNMVLSGTVTNDKSTIIAGGSITGHTGDINNLGATGETVTTNHMTAGENYEHWVSGHPHRNHYRYVNGSPDAFEVELSRLPLALQVWTRQEHTRPATGPNQAIGNTVANNAVPTINGSTLSDNRPGKSVGPGSANAIDGASGNAGAVAETAGSNQTVGTPASALPNLVLPNSQLFTVQSQPDQPYLIETDPKFTNYKTFISSDYLLGRLSLDPQKVQKRLGDGFYEQKLINDQIAQLTGKRFLDGYASNEAQYKALMEAGVASAAQFQLTPGIALSAAQVAALTFDMVWLVEQEVTLPDGSRTKVLAPVVYLSRASAEDIAPTGALISGKDIDLTINGNLHNGGTLQASNKLIVKANDIVNSGDIRSTGKDGSTILVAQNDILNNGGSIAGHRVGILAGRDVAMSTAASSVTGAHGTNTTLGRVASVTADQLSVQAGRDLNLAATAINATGDAVLAAGRDLNLSAVDTRSSYNATYDNDNHLYQTQTQVNGSAINAGGKLALIAGQDINAAAAYANAGGQLVAAAGRDIHIGTAQQTGSVDQATYFTSKGMLSSSSDRSQANVNTSTAVGSTLSGDSVIVQAGRDIGVTGSNIVATNDVDLHAKNNVTISSAQNTSDSSYRLEEKTSGVFSSGGVGFTAGKKEQQNTQTSQQTTQTGSTIGSTDGNIRISAGNAYTQTGSDVIAPKGDIGILAKSVDITAATETMSATQDSKFKQSGVTVAVTNPVISAVQTGQQMGRAASQTGDGRMQVLAGAVTALSTYNAVDAVSKNPGA
ncbi:two-partner secretion domain-containing protein, partial [Collimonas silvisoli]|uniref:two-partner secretion domain-containing protein n=1 Tax=Collimonas silvisoli TaxID=2825884 RepID=UPI001B8B4F40